VSIITGQKLINLSEECLIYPIPATNQLKVMLANNTKKSQIQITDLAGRLYANQQFSGESFSIDLSDMANGSYLIIISQGEKVFNRKFIINR
jgi:hypothetical protein